MKKWIIGIVVMMLVCMQPYVHAATYNEYNINAGSITISQDGYYYIKGNGVTSNTITVNKDINAHIKLEDVNISSNVYNKPAFLIADNSTGDVDIELIGNNTLKGKNAPGICKNGDSDDIGKLTIGGTGSLIAQNTQGDGSGIGSSNGVNTRNITIIGGTITATAGNYGAGIGGGGGGGCASYITISGGTITATGGEDQGAGIGGGSDSGGSKGDASYISITGGTIIAKARGRGAGIGVGNGAGNYISITGGNVTAKGSESNNDIGGNKVSSTPLIQTVPVFRDNDTPASNNYNNILVYQDKTYTVKGTVELNDDLHIQSDEKLVINEDAKLTSQKKIINDGQIDNKGIFTNNSQFVNNGTMTNTNTLGFINNGTVTSKTPIANMTGSGTFELIVEDHTAPTIEGIDDNATYYGSKTIVVKDAENNLDKVLLKIDDQEAKEITLNKDGSYTLTPASKDNVVQVITAVDTKGHSITKKVIINALKNYSFLNGNNGRYSKNSQKDYSIRIDADYNQFVKVEVDNQVVDSKYYSVKSGSTIITFTQEYMSQLKNGTHDVKVYFTDGIATTQMTVYKDVKTDDNHSITLWVGLLCITSLAFVSIRKKKRL